MRPLAIFAQGELAPEANSQLISGDELLFAVAANLVAALVLAFGTVAVRAFRERRSELSGRWFALHPSPGERAKVDRIRVRQRGDRVEGSVKRVLPKDGMQDTKRWKFEGQFVNGRMVGHYRPRGGNYSSASFGVFIMKSAGNRLEGMYFQAKTTFESDKRDIGSPHSVDDFDTLRLRWVRAHNTRRVLAPWPDPPGLNSETYVEPRPVEVQGDAATNA